MKMIVPSSLSLAEDNPLKEEGEGEGEGEEKVMDVRLVVAEVVGMSEIGFSLRISDDDEQIVMKDIVSENCKCWLLLKEGLPNLAIF